MTQTFTTFIVLFFLCAIGVAQDLPDAPSATIVLFPPAKVASKHVRFIPPPAGTRPLIDPTIADATYWTSEAALLGTTTINVEMTARCSEQHTCLTRFAQGSGRLQLYAYTLSTDVVLSYLTYKLKGRTRWWMVPPMIVTGANLFSAGRSFGRLR